MTLYKAVKNLVFTSLDKAVIIDETIELEDEYAKKVNEDLKLTFPDVKAVLVPVENTETTEDDKPKKPTRKKKSDAETETVEDDAAVDK